MKLAYAKHPINSREIKDLNEAIKVLVFDDVRILHILQKCSDKSNRKMGKVQTKAFFKEAVMSNILWNTKIFNLISIIGIKSKQDAIFAYRSGQLKKPKKLH